MITVLRGNDFTIQWTITNPEGSQINLSQIDCHVTIHSRINGPFEISPINKNTGVITAVVHGCMLPTGKYFLNLVCKKEVNGTTRCRRTRTKEVVIITEDIDDVSEGDNLVVTSKMNDFDV